MLQVGAGPDPHPGGHGRLADETPEVILPGQEAGLDRSPHLHSDYYYILTSSYWVGL